MNVSILIGRLTKDPELEYVGSKNTARTRFTLAVDRDFDRENADFIRVTTWGKSAENCDRYLAKGRQVAVCGRIQTGSYENRNGDTVYTTEVVAERVQFLGGGERTERTAEEVEAAIPDEWKAADTLAQVDDDIPF